MPRGFALITGSVSASGALKNLMVTALGSAFAAGVALVPNRAEALLLFTVRQVGSDVEVKASGAYSTDGLLGLETNPPPSPVDQFYPDNPFVSIGGAIAPQANYLQTGEAGKDVYLWKVNFLSRPFGDLGGDPATKFAAVSSGALPVGIDESFLAEQAIGYSYLLLPYGDPAVDSGASPDCTISCSIATNYSTFTSNTIASLGLVPGIYTWTWGASEDQKLTINVEAPGPLPALGAATAFGWSRRLRRRIRGATDASALSASTPLKGQTPADG